MPPTPEQKNILVAIAALMLLAGLVGLLNTTVVSRKKVIYCPQDAKICPDGSSVGRVGQLCEFAECPASVPAGYTLEKYTVEKILPDSCIRHSECENSR